MIVRKHITLRNLSDRIVEEGIDETIARGIDRWKGRPLVTDVRLQSVVPFFRPADSVCFVTMILDVEIEEA